MKPTNRVMISAAALALLMVPATAAAASQPTRDTGLRRGLDQVVAAGAVGALAEVRDEHGVRRAVSGVAELGTTRKVPADGRFRAGSITKTFVATVALQLVAEDRLRLSDEVETWLPGVVPNGTEITMSHLLNHTSGLHDYAKTMPMPPAQEFLDNRWRTWTPAELVERAVAHGPVSEKPGEVYSYSNTNYLLLGQIVEKVTGRPYGDEVERRIIRPLRLHGTSVPGTSPHLPGPHAHGYVPTLRDGELHLLDYTRMNPSMLGASGEIISTAPDLNRFFAALLSGDLLPPHLLAAMKTPGPTGEKYGLGLKWWTTACGIPVYGNEGDALTHQAYTFSTEDGRRRLTVALTPNFRGDPDKAVKAIRDELVCG